MARTIWCRHEICGKPYESVAGHEPDPCPACQQKASWATMPGTPRERRNAKRPRVPYDLTYNDVKLFLERVKIKAD